MLQGIYFAFLVTIGLTLSLRATAAHLPPQLPIGEAILFQAVQPIGVHQGQPQYVNFRIAFNNTDLPTHDSNNNPLEYEADISSEQFSFEHCMDFLNDQNPTCIWVSGDHKSAKLRMGGRHFQAPANVSTTWIRMLLVPNASLLGDTYFTIAVRNPLTKDIVARTRAPHIKGPTIAVTPAPSAITLESPMAPAAVPRGRSVVMAELLSNIDSCTFMCKPMDTPFGQSYEMVATSDAFDIQIDGSHDMAVQIVRGDAEIFSLQQRLHLLPKSTAQSGADTTINFEMKWNYLLSGVQQSRTIAVGQLRGPRIQ